MNALCVSLLAVLVLAHPTDGGDTTTKQLQLPGNPPGFVVVLDYRGGYTVPRKGNEPFMTIAVDGKVTVDSGAPGSKRLEARLSHEELRDLVSFIVRDNNFFGIDSKAIQAEVSKRGVGMITDTSTTVVRMRANGKEQEVSCCTPGFFAEKCPDIKELQQLDATVRRLHRVGMTVRAGGQETIETVLLKVNGELEQRFPRTPPFKAEDLGSARVDELDGTTHLWFYRRGPKGDDGRDTFVSAGVRRSADHNLTVLQLSSTLK